MEQSQLERTRPPGWQVPLGAGIGAALGLVVGFVVGQLAGALVAGAALGVVVGAVASTLAAADREQRRPVLLAAAGIPAVGLAVMLLILVRF